MALAEAAVDQVRNPENVNEQPQGNRRPQVHPVANLLEPEEDLAGVGAGKVLLAQQRVEHIEEDIHACFFCHSLSRSSIWPSRSLPSSLIVYSPGCQVNRRHCRNRCCTSCGMEPGARRIPRLRSSTDTGIPAALAPTHSRMNHPSMLTFFSVISPSLVRINFISNVRYLASFQDFLREEVGLKREHQVIAETALRRIPGFLLDR